jgi:hypothetical protein
MTGRSERPADRSSACAPFLANLGCVPDPQLELQVRQQALEPACVPAGFHPHAPWHLISQLAVKLFGFFAMNQASFAEFTSLRIYKRNLLKARMIGTTYNQHGRLSPALWLVGASKVYSGLQLPNTLVVRLARIFRWLPIYRARSCRIRIGCWFFAEAICATSTGYPSGNHRRTACTKAAETFALVAY